MTTILKKLIQKMRKENIINMKMPKGEIENCVAGKWCVYIDGEYISKFDTEEEAVKFIGLHVPKYEVKQEFPTESKIDGLSIKANEAINDYLKGYCTPDDERKKYKDTQEEPDELSEDEELFKEITEQMLQTYIKKNRDYGGAFERGMERDGIISALTRMYDKLDRLHSLKDKDPEVVEESIQDTLLDLANYAIMTHICLLKSGEKNGTVVYADNQPIMEIQKKGTFEDFCKKGVN